MELEKKNISSIVWLSKEEKKQWKCNNESIKEKGRTIIYYTGEQSLKEVVLELCKNNI